METEQIIKSIIELKDKINNYERESAIQLIIKVRSEHPGKEQIAYVMNNIPLNDAQDENIIQTLQAEMCRLTLKLKDN